MGNIDLIIINMTDISDKPPRESLVQYEPAMQITGDNTHVKHKKDITGKPTSEDVLHAILPQHEWIEEGHHFIQYVSQQPASRVDVVRLQEALDQKLMERQARETGICPVREELHAQCFDELIRQVTLNCPERGLLLLRVRDEIKMTIAAYQTL